MIAGQRTTRRSGAGARAGGWPALLALALWAGLAPGAPRRPARPLLRAAVVLQALTALLSARLPLLIWPLGRRAPAAVALLAPAARPHVPLYIFLHQMVRAPARAARRSVSPSA